MHRTGSLIILKFHALCSLRESLFPHLLGCDGCDFCSNCPVHGVSYCWDHPERTRFSDGGNLTLKNLYVEPGYWRPDNQSLKISPCFNPEACPGGRGGNCKQGYNGLGLPIPPVGWTRLRPVCSVCEDGYMGTPNFRCIKCSGTSTGTVLIVVGSLLTVIALGILTFGIISGNEISANLDGRFLDTTATWRRPLQSLRIVIVAWQILTQFAYAADVVYPGIYGDFLTGIEVFNFDFSWILLTGCVVVLGFGKRLMKYTLGLISFFGFLATTCAFGMMKHRRSQSALATVRRKHISVVIFFTFLMHSSILSILFQTFVDERFLQGVCVLRAHPRIVCDWTELLNLRKLAKRMIFVYT